jgi:GntR family transcriptional repressor for pyruvate dehydrogenase complex
MAAEGTDSVFSELRVKKVNLHMQIADRIQELIQGENLEPGTRMPPERNLAEQLGVNRATLREAIRLLEQRGLVAMKPGMGTFVVDVPLHTVTESLIRYSTFGKGSQGDLLVLREILEPEIAAMAAVNATDREIKTLREQVEQIEAAFQIQDVDAYITADESFHETLAEASHNQLIAGIMKGLRGYMIDLRMHIIVELRPGDKKANRNVFEAIKIKNPDKARTAMQSHMKFARRVFNIAERRTSSLISNDRGSRHGSA